MDARPRPCLPPVTDPTCPSALSRSDPSALGRFGSTAAPSAGSDEDAAYELFRRALVARDEAAWAALYAQYQGLVRAWLVQQPGLASADDLDDLTVRAFARFWQAVPPERFALFPNLASLLRYLKLCAVTALIDEGRARRTGECRLVENQLPPPTSVAGIDELVLDGLTAESLWQAVEAALPDPAERLVIRLSFVAGLKPRQIAAAYGQVFPSVDAVYHRKRLALDRLRRSPRLRGYSARH